VTALNIETGETFESPQIEADIYGLVWSPDNQKIAISADAWSLDFWAPGELHIYVFDLPGRTLRLLIGEDGSP
jgi:hypothetical protein